MKKKEAVPSVGMTGGGSGQKKKKEETRKSNKERDTGCSEDQIHDLAEAFWKHLLDHPDLLEQASVRDGTHVVFQQWLSSSSSSLPLPSETIIIDDNTANNGTDDDNGTESKEMTVAQRNRRRRRLEALVLTRMRQESWVKSKRYSDTVLMVFADANGDFPPRTDKRVMVRLTKAQEQQRVNQENKHAVTVHTAHVAAEDPFYSEDATTTTKPITVARGQPRLLNMDVDYLMMGDIEDNFSEYDDGARLPSPDDVIDLEAVEFIGHQAKQFRLVAPTEFPLLTLKEHQTIQLSVLVPQTYIGVLRVAVRFRFLSTPVEPGEEQELFTIDRWVRVKGATAVDPAVDQVLQPTAPYQRRTWRPVGKTPDHVFGPPPQPPPSSGSVQNQDNPFQSLPQHWTPPDVRNMIEAGEFEMAMVPWPGDPADDDDDDSGSGSGVIPVEPSEDRVKDKYGRFWKDLLFASEYQMSQDIQLFDMEDVQLKRLGRNFSFEVPGLAESRPSVLRGDIVHVTWNKRLFKGRVVQIQLLDIVLEFHRTFHQTYSPALDRVDVRFTFSRMAFRCMHEACTKAESSMRETMLLPTDEIKAKIAVNARDVGNLSWANRDLNEEQRVAVCNIVRGGARPLPYIIFGPPGTGASPSEECCVASLILKPLTHWLFVCFAGKTTTVVETVYQLARHPDKLKILLVAPSNDAADVLVERLLPYFPPSELRRILAYTRNISMLPAAVRPYASEDSSTEEQVTEILSSRIIVTTVNMAAKFSYWGVPKGHFDIFCVDEAGHATEPEVICTASTLMSFFGEESSDSESSSHVGQMILAGDPRQLGPVITSSLCKKFGLGVSYMERLTLLDVYQRKNGVYPDDLLTKLVRNYRSHPAVLKLPNEMFYDGELQTCGDIMTTHSLANWEHLPMKGFPVMFHAIEGENLREENSPSWFNPQEAEQVIEYVHLLLNETRPPLRAEEIGIITPYARQAQKIRKALVTKGITDIKVGSVEMFQGQERRCIIVSTVRAESGELTSDLRYNLGFVGNSKRFNVAITRAKTLLIVVGCPRLLAMDKVNWRPFLEYCHENDSWCGEEWDPVDDMGDDGGGEFEEQEYDVIVAGPSRVAEQEAIAAVYHEE